MPDQNPMHEPGTVDAHWCTDNVGEAAPGALTPLSASVWSIVGDAAPREVAFRIGVFDRHERKPVTTPEHRVATVFYGRFAMKVEYMAQVGDRLPGTTGEDTLRGLFGYVPDGITFEPTRRRYPTILMKLPWAFLNSPRRIRRLAADTETWWATNVVRLDALDHVEAIALFGEAVERFRTSMVTHTVGLLGTVQPLYGALEKLTSSAGIGDVAALSGAGGAEMAIVSDLWQASRGQMDLEQVVRHHGFHGPAEGELASRVWREDTTPLERAVTEYRAKPDDCDPRRRVAEAARLLPGRQREVLAALPRSRRPAARLLLRLAARQIPLRGVGKRAFLQSIDIARGAARSVGRVLAAQGQLDDPDDVFYLTVEELTGRLPADMKTVVTERRLLRSEYQGLDIPGSWRGIPEAIPDSSNLGSTSADDVAIIQGTGVSAGVVEGPVRVITDPSEADSEPGEILVAPTTDPSWAAIMFVSAALVVDIGGALSHAAVVARELGLPCVVNTRTGSKVLRTGDIVRVDGGSGTVEILKRGEPT